MKLQVQAPGRLNIIGEHTDYNDGFVLPAAINRYITFDLNKNETDSVIDLTAQDVGEQYIFDLFDESTSIYGWRSYVFGVVQELRKAGYILKGCTGHFSGTIPQGSGLSSSAALSCGLCLGLAELFHLDIDRLEMARIAQRAEHHYAGTACGIMDQYASLFGRHNHATFLDCRTLETSYHAIQFEDYQFVLINSQVTHALADTAYNKRRKACEEGVDRLRSNDPDITHLRDVSLGLLQKVKKNLDPEVYNRCFHVITENQRVLQAVDALDNNNLHKLGELMYDSHYSLQHMYQVSCDELDFLVDSTKSHISVLGSRMMGGGFGGCTINLIQKNKVEQVTEKIAAAYQERFHQDISVYAVDIVDGVQVVSSNA